MKADLTRRNLLVVLCRAPRPGAVMRRLSPPLDHRQASAAYAAALLDTERTVSALSGVDAWFASADAPSPALTRLLRPGTHLIEQRGDHSERLADAFDRGFADGYTRICVLTADVPDLPAPYIQTAFARLGEDPDLAALGPTLDGGCYLVGLSRSRPDLFRGIPWHDARAWPALRAAAARLSLPLAILPRWQDVATWSDLQDCLERGHSPHLMEIHAAGLLAPRPEPVESP